MAASAERALSRLERGRSGQGRAPPSPPSCAAAAGARLPTPAVGQKRRELALPLLRLVSAVRAKARDCRRKDQAWGMVQALPAAPSEPAGAARGEEGVVVGECRTPKCGCVLRETPERSRG